MLSVHVVYWIFLQIFQTYVLHTGKRSKLLESPSSDSQSHWFNPLGWLGHKTSIQTQFKVKGEQILSWLFSGGRQNDFIIVASLESVSFTFNRGDCLIQVVLRTAWTVLYMMLYRYLSSYWMNSWHMVKEQIVGYSVPSQGGSVLYQWQKEWLPRGPRNWANQLAIW